MRPGPQRGQGANGDIRTFAVKASDAWGPALPDWVIVLAETADVRGLIGAAKAIGYSGSLVSTVLANKYRGDLLKVAEMVRGALMGVTVICPRLDEMTRDTCFEWQKKPFAATSSLRVEMFHACRSGCPHSRIKGGSDA